MRLRRCCRGLCRARDGILRSLERRRWRIGRRSFRESCNFLWKTTNQLISNPLPKPSDHPLPPLSMMFSVDSSSRIAGVQLASYASTSVCAPLHSQKQTSSFCRSINTTTLPSRNSSHNHTNSIHTPRRIIFHKPIPQHPQRPLNLLPMP